MNGRSRKRQLGPAAMPAAAQVKRICASYTRRLSHTLERQLSFSREQQQALLALRREQFQMQEIVQGAAIRVMEEQQRTQTILSALGQGLFGLDSRGGVQFLNAASERIMGWTESDLQGIPLHDLLHPARSRDSVCTEETCPLLNVQSSGRSHRVENDTFYDHAHRAVSVAYFCTPIYRAGEQVGSLIAFDDITERLASSRALDAYARQVQEQNSQLSKYCEDLTFTQKQLEQQTHELTAKNAQIIAANQILRGLATTDSMTGLSNHRAFQEALHTAWSSTSDSSLISLLLFDVDNFKTFNDVFGHPAGDEVLQTVASLIRSTVQDTMLAARYGGEEFAVVAWNTDAAAARILGDQICASIASHAFPCRPITLSAGIATHDIRPETQEGALSRYSTPDALIRAADDALYAAKKAGKNRAVSSPPCAPAVSRAA